MNTRTIARSLYWETRYRLGLGRAHRTFEGQRSTFRTSTRSEFTRVNRLRGEEHVWSLFMARLAPTDVVIDAGSHIGTYAIPAARRAKVVHCFDADRYVMDRLSYNLSLNAGVMSLCLRHETLTNLDSYKIPATALKMDIEGAELDVLRHSAKTLTGCHTVLIEVHQKHEIPEIERLLPSDMLVRLYPRGEETHLLGTRERWSLQK